MLASDQVVSADSRWVNAARAGRRIGHGVEFHASLPSTNDRARTRLADADGDGLAVVAELQTAGRGRRGRTWESPAGTNLLLSVGLRPRGVAAATAWQISAAAALAGVRACAPWAALAVRWPNDLVTADGLKVAGLLIETAAEDDALTEAVVGIGMNVNWRRADMPSEIAVGATSLADIAGTEVNRVAVATRLLEELDRQITAIEAGRSPYEAYRAASWLTGRLVDIDVAGTPIRDRVTGIADDGGLELEGRPGSLTAGEVVRVRTADDGADD